jgi:hypothetical protein
VEVVLAEGTGAGSISSGPCGLGGTGEQPKPVVHLKLLPQPGADNPSYSGGGDQEDCGLNSALANSLRDPISKITNTKKDW